jgi:hypothetical protein
LFHEVIEDGFIQCPILGADADIGVGYQIADPEDRPIVDHLDIEVGFRPCGE